MLTNRKKAPAHLQRLFDTNSEAVLLRPFTPRRNFVFDFDGVLLAECGVAEVGYAWLVRAFRDGNWDVRDLDVSDGDRREALALRPGIKGKAPVEKVEILGQRYGSGESLSGPAVDLVRMWFAVLAGEIGRRFGDDPDSYLLPGARELVCAAQEVGPTFGLTANIQEQAEFLMEFVGLRESFDEVVGYPADARAGISKATLLVDLLRAHCASPDESCYIGDGVPDVRAALEAGVLAVGVANDLQGGLRLIDAGCHVLCTSSACGRDVVRVLATGTG